MTNYENDHLNPPNEREPKYTKCETCEGSGYRLEWCVDLDIDGGNYIKEKCNHSGCVDGWIEY